MFPKPYHYFRFSKIERRGVFCLVSLIVVMLFINHWLNHNHHNSDLEQLAQQYYQALNVEHLQAELEEWPNEPEKMQLFKFDPNEIKAEDWQKLGFSSAQAQSILNYKNKGGKFKIKSDLLKLYVVSDEKYVALKPFINLPDALDKRTTLAPASRPKRKTPKLLPISINTADSADLVSLRGIGPVLSKRILKYRKALGGFHSIDQLTEVYGLEDSVYQSILDRLVLDTVTLKKIDLNQANFEQLKRFPYINWHMANVIVKYRKQHGNYVALEDLLNIKIIDSSLTKKLKPYLEFK